MRRHPKSRAALYIMTTLENFDLKAITVLKRKKKWHKYCNFIHFPFLFRSYRFYNPPRLYAFDVLFQKRAWGFHQGFQARKKLMEARDRRLSAFIVFECLKTRMKPDAQFLKYFLNLFSRHSRMMASKQQYLGKKNGNFSYVMKAKCFIMHRKTPRGCKSQPTKNTCAA